jgi:hypothetical protein
MSGGDIIAVVLASAVLGAATVAFIVLLAEAQDWRREEERPETPWGDVVEVPAAARKAGGAAQRRGGKVAQDVIARRHSGAPTA